MEIRVKVIPNKKKEIIKILNDGRYCVEVDADRKGGEANNRVIKLIASHFGVESNKVSLISGHTQGTKTIRITGL